MRASSRYPNRQGLAFRPSLRAFEISHPWRAHPHGDGSTPDPRRVEGQRLSERVGQGRDETQPDRQDPLRRAPFPRHSGIRRNRRPPDPERHPLSARHAFPRPPRSGQDPDAPPTRPPARRRHARHRRVGGERRPLRAALQGRTRQDRLDGRRDADRLGRPRASLSGKAGHARRYHRRPRWRGRHDQACRGDATSRAS